MTSNNEKILKLDKVYCVLESEMSRLARMSRLIIIDFFEFEKNIIENYLATPDTLDTFQRELRRWIANA